MRVRYQYFIAGVKNGEHCQQERRGAAYGYYHPFIPHFYSVSAAVILRDAPAELINPEAACVLRVASLYPLRGGRAYFIGSIEIRFSNLEMYDVSTFILKALCPLEDLHHVERLYVFNQI